MTAQLSRRGLVLGMAGMAGLATLGAVPARASGTIHDIQMLNTDPSDPARKMVFSPRLLAIEPGDTLRFLPTNPGHNSQTINGMVPDGAEGWRSVLNREFEVQLTVPGFYGYVCLPHQAMGMVGLVVVRGEGMLDNLEAARGVRHRGRAVQAFEEIWAEAETAGLLTA